MVATHKGEHRAIVTDRHARQKGLVGGLVVEYRTHSHQEIVRLGCLNRSNHAVNSTEIPTIPVVMRTPSSKSQFSRTERFNDRSVLAFLWDVWTKLPSHRP